MPKSQVVRYALVGLGHIAQVAVLPAFAHARNARLAAMVSDDPAKHRKLSKKYNVGLTYSCEQYEDCLNSGEVDAVYIALPNNMHCDFTVRAARAGIHVLCEKPMAVTEDECEQMIRATAKARVKLMIAYRLHFEKANLEAVKIVPMLAVLPLQSMIRRSMSSSPSKKLLVATAVNANTAVSLPAPPTSCSARKARACCT